MRILLNTSSFAINVFAATVAAFGQQPMTDNSSVYDDMWFDNTNVYITGSTSGSVSTHEYQVDLTISTPSGTHSTSTPGFGCNYPSNTLSAACTAADLNADFVSTAQHDYFCTTSNITPVLFFGRFSKRPTKPNYTCTAGATNVCVDGYTSAPLGPIIGPPRCVQWNYCCNASNQYYSGCCRSETCRKVTGEPRDPVFSGCMNLTNCFDQRIKMWCQ